MTRFLVACWAGAVLVFRVLVFRVLARRVLARRVLVFRVLAGRVLVFRVLAGRVLVRLVLLLDRWLLRAGAPHPRPGSDGVARPRRRPVRPRRRGMRPAAGQPFPRRTAARTGPQHRRAPWQVRVCHRSRAAVVHVIALGRLIRARAARDRRLSRRFPPASADPCPGRTLAGLGVGGLLVGGVRVTDGLVRGLAVGGRLVGRFPGPASA